MNEAREGWSVRGVGIEDLVIAARTHGGIGLVVVDHDLRVHVSVRPANEDDELAGPSALVEHEVGQVLSGDLPGTSRVTADSFVEAVVPVLDDAGEVVAVAQIWFEDEVSAEASASAELVTRIAAPVPDVGAANGLLQRLVSPMNLLALVISILTIAIAVLVYQSTRDSTSEALDLSPHAPKGSLSLPASIPAAPSSGPWTAAPSDANVVPPTFVGTYARQGCSTLCTYQFDFTSAMPSSLVMVSLYVANVFPYPDAQPSLSAYSGSDDGSGSVVVQVPFVEGWVCYRLLMTFGTFDVEPSARSNWSGAECFDLDRDGYVVGAVARP